MEKVIKFFKQIRTKDYLFKPKQIEKTKPINIFIACFPKSGSTYITKLLSLYLDFEISQYVHLFDRREQEWEKDIVKKVSEKNAIICHHTKASFPTIDLIETHGIKNIVLVRNIFDVVISLRDHLIKESVDIPMLFVNESFKSLTYSQQLDMVIDLAVPWYINFYASWYDQSKRGYIFFLTYENFFEDKAISFKEILDYFEFDFKESKYQTALKSLSSDFFRYNQGKSGRGEEDLTVDQINRIRKIASHHRDVNFSLIGL